ncbi:MAG TPA: c-type cytochrome [Acidobacteriaceae bacterium]
MRAVSAEKVCGMGVLVLAAGSWMGFPALSQSAAKAAGDARQDAGGGRLLFEKRCSGCHSMDGAKEGPPLRGVYGRKVGTAAGFAYSDALKGAHVVWDEVSLNQWLSNTESVVPGNDMDFAVPRAEERAEIVRYLKESSGK